MTDDFDREPGDMEDVIDRVHRNEASADEVRTLEAWRRLSAANEQSYRRTLRLLEVAGSLAPRTTASMPTAATILAAPRAAPRPAWRATVARVAPWTVAAAAVVAFLLTRSTTTAPASWGLADVVTGESEMATLSLVDGSVVRLAPASRLHFITSDSAREVKLDGRAFFVVAHLAGKSFVVHTTGGDARVLGTRFEIATDKQDLRLLVVEGRVALSSGSDRVEVTGGEVSGVRNAVMLPPVRAQNAERMEAWVGKFMVFQATPMHDAVRQIERMYGVHIRIDSTVANRTVSATFTDRTVEEVLDVICSATHAGYERRADEIAIVAKQ